MSTGSATVAVAVLVGATGLALLGTGTAMADGSDDPGSGVSDDLHVGPEEVTFEVGEDIAATPLPAFVSEPQTSPFGTGPPVDLIALSDPDSAGPDSADPSEPAISFSGPPAAALGLGESGAGGDPTHFGARPGQIGSDDGPAASGGGVQSTAGTDGEHPSWRT